LLFGQFESGTVLGTIHDPSGATMANVSVSLENTKTAVTLKAKTDNNGNYEFINVRLGSYRVTVVARGFETLTTDPFDLLVNARANVSTSTW
jgi:hypothetical protein